MSFKELAIKRRSCRHYLAQTVSREEISEILAEANLSPSACNSQPWHFYVADTAEKKQEIAEAVHVFENTNRFAGEAGALIILTQDTEPAVFAQVKENYGCDRFGQIDTGLVTAYLTLAAEDRDLNTCIMGVFDEAKLRAIASIPETEVPRLVVALGYGSDNDRPHTKKRYPAEEKINYL